MTLAARAGAAGRIARPGLIARWAVSLGLVFLLLGLMFGGRYLGWTVPAESVEARGAALQAHWRVVRPAEATGPFPAALLFGGCDGPMDNLDRWASMLAERGWASVIVDSHAPRGIAGTPFWRAVCAGLLMQGTERAGDVLAAVERVRGLEDFDGERLLLVGSSHGGWTLMELLRLEAGRRVPPGLRERPERGLAGVRGAILLYPYCGAANRARGGWSHGLPVLMIQSGSDGISPARACIRAAERARDAGSPVELLVLDEARHGFDQARRSSLSTLDFDPEATAAALAAGAAFLDARK